MHRGGDALTVTVGAGRVGRRRPMEEAILRVVVEVVEMVELTVAEVEAATLPLPPLVLSCVGGSRPTEVVELPMLAERAVAKMEAETR